MGYLEELRRLEEKGVYVGYGRRFQTWYFYMVDITGEEIPLMVEDDDGKLVHEVHCGDSLDRMETIEKFAKRRLYVAIEDLPEIYKTCEETTEPINGVPQKSSSWL